MEPPVSQLHQRLETLYSPQKTHKIEFLYSIVLLPIARLNLDDEQ